MNEKVGDVRAIVYLELVSSVRKADVSKALEEYKKVLESHLFATEGYHSFGGVRTVVVAGQMKRPLVTERLSLNDYYACMIENWGFSLCIINKCDSETSVRECFKDASKYLWRLFTCMNTARDVMLKDTKSVRKFPTKNDLAAKDLHDARPIRDLFAEFLFLFKKPQKNVPPKYPGRDNIDKEIEQLLTVVSSSGVPNTCTSLESCKQSIEVMMVEYSKTIYTYYRTEVIGAEENVQDYTKEFQGVNEYRYTGSFFTNIIYLDVNQEYFDYVTTAEKKFSDCRE